LSKKLNISIGILAYNEADSITATLQSLFQQSLLIQAAETTVEITVEIIVVPNGCTDDTAAIAKNSLISLSGLGDRPNFSWQVCELKQPGKANAWNHYVHQFSDSQADYLILMDADIQFLEPKTLDSLVYTLERTANAWVSVDRLVKDIALKPKKNLIETLSVAVSKVSGAKSAWICGQLYCGRADQLRKIWMPIGTLVEDGFLWQMVVTDCLTSPERLDRVVRADSASHIFEAYTNIEQLFRHELRQVVGNTINAFAYSDLQAGSSPLPAATLIRSRNEQDPRWLDGLIQARVKKKGRWVVPTWLLFRRFKSLPHLSWQKALLMFPIAVFAFFVDLLLCYQANIALHQWGVKESNRSVKS